MASSFTSEDNSEATANNMRLLLVMDYLEWCSSRHTMQYKQAETVTITCTLAHQTRMELALFSSVENLTSLVSSVHVVTELSSLANLASFHFAIPVPKTQERKAKTINTNALIREREQKNREPSTDSGS